MWLRIILLVVGLALGVAVVLLGKPWVESQLLRILIAALLLTPVPVMILVGWLRKRKAKAVIAEAAKPKLPPEERASIQGKLKRLREVLAAAKVAGDAPLHLMPRVLVIGEPGAGKSAAIRRSKLEFPFTTTPEGGSNEFEVWLSRRGTILDTPGRWCLDDPEHHSAWLAFLALLAKDRRPTAVDGILAVVDLDEVLSCNADEREMLASRLRRRLLEAMDTLGWRMPVSILFTKSDRIYGFVESFAVLPSAERTQPFGFIVESQDPNTILPGLENLIRHTRTEAYARLPRLEDHLRPPTFAFAEQMSAASVEIALFLRRLLEPGASGDQIALAGAYFGSAAQEGRKLDRLGDRVSDLFEIKTAPAGVAKQREGRSYFLHELFAKAVMGGAVVVERSTAGRRRWARSTMLGSGLLTALALFVLGAAAISYQSNRTLIDATVAEVRATTPKQQDALVDTDLVRIAPLRPVAERLETLENWERTGPPLWYRFGLYQGTALLPSLRRAFERPMRGLFVDRVGVELESMLSDPTGSGDVAQDYDVLKAYLMLTQKVDKIEPDWVGAVLVEVWKRRLDTTAAAEAELLLSLSQTYARQVMRKAARWPTASDILIGNARQNLRRRDAEYGRIMADARSKLARPLPLKELLGGRVPDALRAGSEVERLYTLDGWRAVRSSFKKTNGANAWVLGEHASEEAMIGKTRQRYFDRFAAEWRRFLRNLSIREPSSLPDAKNLLDDLTASKPSKLEELFLGMEIQMSFPTVADDAPDATNLIKNQRKRELAKALKKKKPTEMNSVEREFDPLFQLVNPRPDATGKVPKAAMTEVVSKLADVRAAIEKLGSGENADTREVESAIEAARSAVDMVLRDVPKDLVKLVKPLLLASLRGVTAEAATERYQRTMKNLSLRVCEPFHDSLARRYPFDRKASEDALPDSVVQIFGPKGAAWTFFAQGLQKDLSRTADTLTVEKSGPIAKGVLPFYRKALLVETTLFPGGAAALTREFDVRPKGVVTSGGAGHATGVTFELGKQRRTYKFGPAETWSFTWPTKPGRARLKLEGLNEPALEAWGDWALFRLADNAAVKPLAGGWVELRFSFKGGKVQVPLHFRTSGTRNPLAEYTRFRINCPKVAEAP